MRARVWLEHVKDVKTSSSTSTRWGYRTLYLTLSTQVCNTPRLRVSRSATSQTRGELLSTPKLSIIHHGSRAAPSVSLAGGTAVCVLVELVDRFYPQLATLLTSPILLQGQVSKGIGYFSGVQHYCPRVKGEGHATYQHHDQELPTHLLLDLSRHLRRVRAISSCTRPTHTYGWMRYLYSNTFRQASNCLGIETTQPSPAVQTVARGSAILVKSTIGTRLTETSEARPWPPS